VQFCHVGGEDNCLKPSKKENEMGLTGIYFKFSYCYLLEVIMSSKWWLCNWHDIA
jgi:hypothetical protein